MGKSKRNKPPRPRSKPPRKARAEVAPPPPASPNLTLPSSLTVAQIQELQNLLEQRRVVSDFRDAAPGTLYIKRRDDPEDMAITVTAVKYDNQLRAILGSLVEKSEQDLEKLGIDLSELESAEPPGDDESDLATLLAEATEVVAKLKAQADAGDADAAGDPEPDDDEPDDPDDPDASDLEHDDPPDPDPEAD